MLKAKLHSSLHSNGFDKENKFQSSIKYPKKILITPLLVVSWPRMRLLKKIHYFLAGRL